MSTRSPPKEQLFTTLQKKKTGCEGKAAVQRIQSEGDDGNMKRNWAVSSPSVHLRFHYPDRIKLPSQLTTLSLKWFIFVIHRSGQRQDFESRAPWKNLGWMVENFSSCRTCGKHSHNLQNLYHWIRSTHDTTVRSPSCSSINHWQMDWIGWQMFRISGCYFQCWRTANLCGILWRE